MINEDNEMSDKTGVYIDKLKNGNDNYRASFTYNQKHISLGSYNSMNEANRAYLYAKELFSNKDISIEDYSTYCPLKFDKYIEVINLRDNKIVFPTPVYLRKSYFSYFYSPDIELKFDMDDLFYFTSHKIMKRGNHFFVSDFGSQESINERFGIRAFSVLGKDHIFLNEDLYDYRRHNIEIINPYFGVRQNKQEFYVTIHVIGDLKVGIFDDITVAAIAYNKAADTLIKNGIKKNFNTNYIMDISPREYAIIYSEIKMPDNILTYK